MTDPLNEAELAAFEQGLYLGTLRSSVAAPARLVAPGEAQPEVAALAFATQQRRLSTGLSRRATTLKDFESGVPDPRPALPDELRTPLRELIFRAKLHRQSGPLIALRWLLERHRVRPHPFDATLVEGVRALKPLVEGAHAVGEGQWLEGSPAERVAWLRAKRAENPAEAREALASVFSGEKPETRGRLLAALEIGLSPDDGPFLEKVSKDRSAKVKAEVRRLALRVSGPAQDAALDALEEVVEMRSVSAGGRRRLGLKKGQSKRSDAAARGLRYLPVGRVAERLGAAPIELAQLDRTAEPFAQDLLYAAIEGGELELIDALATTHELADILEVSTLALLARLPPPLRAPVVDVLVSTGLGEALINDLSLAEAWIADVAEPLTEEGSVRMRATPEYQLFVKALADPKKAEGALLNLGMVAPLVPPADAAAAAAEIRAQGPHAGPVLALLFSLLDRSMRTLSPAEAKPHDQDEDRLQED